MDNNRKLKAITGLYPQVRDTFLEQNEGLYIYLDDKGHLFMRWRDNIRRIINKLPEPKNRILYCPVCYSDNFKKTDREYYFTCENKHTTLQINLLLGNEQGVE